MDLDSYIGRYSGETRLKRLLLIAETTADEALANRAFDMVEQQLRRDGNVKRYKEVFGGVDDASRGGGEGQTPAGGPTSGGTSGTALLLTSLGGNRSAEQPIIVDLAVGEPAAQSTAGGDGSNGELSSLSG